MRSPIDLVRITDYGLHVLEGDIVVTEQGGWTYGAYVDGELHLADERWQTRDQAEEQAKHERAVNVDWLLHSAPPHTVIEMLGGSQNEVAAMLGTSQGMVSMWANQKRQEMSKSTRMLALAWIKGGVLL